MLTGPTEEEEEEAVKEGLVKKTNLETDPASVSLEVFTVLQVSIPLYWETTLCQWVIRYSPHPQGSECLRHCPNMIAH
jgi:hypothetical protein